MKKKQQKLLLSAATRILPNAMTIQLVNITGRNRKPGQLGIIETKKFRIQNIFSFVCILLLFVRNLEMMESIPQSMIMSEYEGFFSYKSVPCPKTRMDATTESSNAIPHAKELRNATLCRSLEHQHKFFSVRDSVLSWVKSHQEHRYLLRGTGRRGGLFAFIINEDYAFRHIFKSGGTTIEKQTGVGPYAADVPQDDNQTYDGHVPQWKVGDRSLMTTVRDPIDHFLSGWAECGYRCFDEMMNLTASDAYDDRVTAWLQYLRLPKGVNQGKGCLKECRPHSLPQANYLWENDRTFEWDAKLDLVGDLDEMSGLLELIGFHYDESLTKAREAKDNEVKNRSFPPKKSMLSNSTLDGICSYVALDYYLFSFEPPVACREQLMTNIADMNVIIQ